MELKNYRLGVAGPKGLQKLISMGTMFYAGIQNLNIYEYGQLSQPFRDKNKKEDHRRYIKFGGQFIDKEAQPKVKEEESKQQKESPRNNHD